MTLRWSEGALEYLLEIYNHVAQDRPNAAERIAPAKVPKKRPGNKRTATRLLTVPGLPYVIDYELEAGHLNILRVCHGSRSIPRFT